MTAQIQPPAASTEQALADELNRGCFCLDVADGEQAYLTQADAGFTSPLAVFVSHAQVDAMQAVIDAVEAVVALPAFRERALAEALPIARASDGVPAVLHGFDFHLGTDGPRLIEVNTNAGGAMVVADHLRRVRMPCGDLTASLGQPGAAAGLDDRFWAMFQDVWQRCRGDRPLELVAIVDRQPESQFLHPELVRFRQLFEARGAAARIADPQELHYADGALRLDGCRVDLVYNRLTDFYFETAEADALRQAYLDGTVVVTPDPQAHALHASKRNLVWLSNPRQLADWGLDRVHIEALHKGIPHTEVVDRAAAASLWARRRTLFFKPVSGFGSRGAYRGDKLTRGTFERILDGEYIAQALIPASLRSASDDESGRPLKFDVRNYVYDGRVLLRGARLYQGQTTNFRSPGGGFAPLVYPPPQMRNS